MAIESDDEYSAYDDFSELTQAQLAQLDLEVASSSSLPKIQVELERSPGAEDGKDATSEPSEISRAEPLTPLRQFRRNNILSVTDLVAPAWCEVQFDYGLRQKRHMKLKDRPASFTSIQGKEIFADRAVAASSDKIKKKGVSVHKTLEREIRPEEIKVTITSSEERWGLRILNMIDCVESLLLLGCAREMPVFGVVEGYVTVGIIDEITISQASSSPSISEKKRGFHSAPSTPTKPKRRRRSPSPTQSRITTFLSPHKASDAEPPSVFGPSLHLHPPSSPKFDAPTLHLIDTKTRRTNSLPRDEDTLSSRYQLMLYFCMLTDLMSTSDPFDFTSFWKTLDLNPTASFSESFLSQTLLDQDEKCLDDLGRLWRNAVSRLDGAKIDPTLQLVYRLQPSSSGRRWNRSAGKSRAVTSSREELEIAKAVEASLQAVSNNEGSSAKLSPHRTIPDLEFFEQETNLEEDPELRWAIQQSLLLLHQAESGPIDVAHKNSQKPTSEQPIAAPQQAEIIGTKEFFVDTTRLDEYLADILEWWTGARKPRGVSLSQTGRCGSCEYSDSCEWREQKANEFQLEMRNRRQQCTTSALNGVNEDARPRTEH